MHLVSYRHAGESTVGLLVNDQVVDIRTIDANLPTTMKALLERGEPALDRLRAADPASLHSVALSQVELLPPVPDAGKIICIGLNYIDHACETGFTAPTYPVVFLRGATSLVAAGQPVLRPAVSADLDFEAELVAVIGKRCKSVKRQDALDFVAGYSLFNDASIRDFQMRTHQWTIGKNFDATGAFGPALVTADELPAGASGLAIETRLNGNLVQSANTRDMIFDVAHLIEILSEAMTLMPGDLIVTGTPSGVGAARQPPLWMQPGDRCEVTVEGVGTLSNPIAQG